MDIKIRKNTDKYALLFRKKIERWTCFFLFDYIFSHFSCLA